MAVSFTVDATNILSFPWLEQVVRFLPLPLGGKLCKDIIHEDSGVDQRWNNLITGSQFCHILLGSLHIQFSRILFRAVHRGSG